MARKSIGRLGDLQLRILQVLWEHPESSVAEVQSALGSRYAYTTVATMLRKMEERRLVKHREEGRRFLYSAAVSSTAVSQGLTDRLVHRVFGGNLASVVSHLLESHEVDLDELQELESLIHQHRKRKESR